MCQLCESCVHFHKVARKLPITTRATTEPPSRSSAAGEVMALLKGASVVGMKEQQGRLFHFLN